MIENKKGDILNRKGHPKLTDPEEFEIIKKIYFVPRESADTPTDPYEQLDRMEKGKVNSPR